MKRVAIGLIITAVVACVGYTSYSLVRFAKEKAQDKIVSEKVESSETGNSKDTQSTGKEVENSKENSSESTPNNVPSTPSPEDYSSIEYEKEYELPEGEFDFSSPDAFFLSYNTLVDKIGTDVTKKSIRSEYYKAAMTISSVGDVEVWSYQHDNSIRIIYIKGKDVTEEVRRHINGTAKVSYENGNTIIDLFVN